MSINKVSILKSIDQSTFEGLKKYTNLAVIVDENTKRDCYPLVQTFLPEHTLIEVVNTLHSGKAVGSKDVDLIVFYAGEKGQKTTILKE